MDEQRKRKRAAEAWWSREPEEACVLEGVRVGRVSIDGGLHFGTIVDDGALVVSYGGRTKEYRSGFEVLCCSGAPGACFGVDGAWSGGAVPPAAVACGFEADGEPLFLALVDDGDRGAVVGKVRAGFGGALFARDGLETKCEDYRAVTLAPEATLADDSRPAPRKKTRRRWLASVDELERWTADAGVGANADLDRSAAAPTPALRGGPRVLHCHDMKGGYCEAADEIYLQKFRGWSEIDIFCYFSHHFCTVPPKCWIDACHARGVRCLGTIIVEGAGGTRETERLLAGDAVAKLAEVVAHYGFDGFLLNLESPLQNGASDAPRVVRFVESLKATLPGDALVVTYDALDLTTGKIAYQNALTPKNDALLRAADGLFTNYWWDDAALDATAALAGDRRTDVYVGVDCWARGTTYGPGPAAASAVDAIASRGLSCALFAPAWTVEANDDDAVEAHLWAALDVARIRGAA